MLMRPSTAGTIPFSSILPSLNARRVACRRQWHRPALSARLPRPQTCGSKRFPAAGSVLRTGACAGVHLRAASMKAATVAARSSTFCGGGPTRSAASFPPASSSGVLREAQRQGARRAARRDSVGGDPAGAPDRGTRRALAQRRSRVRADRPATRDPGAGDTPPGKPRAVAGEEPENTNQPRFRATGNGERNGRGSHASSPINPAHESRPPGTTHESWPDGRIS